MVQGIGMSLQTKSYERLVETKEYQQLFVAGRR